MSACTCPGVERTGCPCERCHGSGFFHEAIEDYNEVYCDCAAGAKLCDRDEPVILDDAHGLREAIVATLSSRGVARAPIFYVADVQVLDEPAARDRYARLLPDVKFAAVLRGNMVHTVHACACPGFCACPRFWRRATRAARHAERMRRKKRRGWG